MLEADFARARPMTAEGVAGKPLWFTATARLAHLTAPLL